MRPRLLAAVSLAAAVVGGVAVLLIAWGAGWLDGDRRTVVVESPRGAVTGTALLWPDMREDVVFVPTTFGPMQKLGAEYGLPAYESVNTLTDDRYFDNLSGQQAYKCFACRVLKA